MGGSDMIENKREPAKYRNFSLAFEKMCNFVAIANTQSADDTLRQLILQCFVVLPDDRFENPLKITETIDGLFGLQIPEHWVQSSLDRLIEQNVVQRSPANNYILNPKPKIELQKGIDEAMTLEESVKNGWFAEIVYKFPTLSTEQAWTVLKGYLARAFRRHGIQTVALLDPNVDVAPEYTESLSFLLNDVLQDTVAKEQRAATEEAVSLFFMNVGKHPNRAKFITQLGDGAFNYFSLTVEPDTAEQFRKRLQPLTLFLDTNFLFGVLDLHVNPHVEVSNELLRSTQRHNLPFELRYHEATEKEMQFTINYYWQMLRSRKWERGISRAATTARYVSGVVAKYHQMNAEKGIDVDTFFAVYRHTDELLKDKNIIIFKTDTQQEEIINERVLQYQDFLSKLGKEKPDKVIEHDMVVLDAVRRLRSDVKSSIEAKALLITCDYMLYRFDWETSRQEGRLASVVLPNLFWQILRPFVPSDSDFDRSFAETFAIPEFRTIGSGAAEACSKLLCLLALYKNFPEETAARLLSNDLLIDGLRKIKDDKEIQEYVESAIAADNISLMEEKAAIEKQLKAERAQRGGGEKELEQAYEKKEKELESLKKAISDKKEEVRIAIEKEKQAREDLKKAERKSEVYNSVFGCVLSLILIILFEYIIHKIPWHWLLEHKNSYGLQGAFDFFIFSSALGLFKSKWRKLLWSGSLVFSIILVILSLLGGPPSK